MEDNLVIGVKGEHIKTLHLGRGNGMSRTRNMAGDHLEDTLMGLTRTQSAMELNTMAAHPRRSL